MNSTTICRIGLILVLFVQLNTLFCQNRFELPTVKSIENNTVTIDQFHINVSVVGCFAITTYDMTFKNSSSRILEGQLNLPMQEGESVIGYQLEVNGKMRKGVVIEKEEARQIFEEVVNRKVDPGIIEKTQGNNYRTRLYPIPANGYKRVIITTQQNLAKDGEKYNYMLPYASNQILSKFSLVLEVFQNEKPQLTPNNIGSLDFENVENIYRLSLKKENFVLKEPLQFSIPVNEKTDTPLYEKNEKEQFFYQNFSNAFNVPKQYTPSTIDPSAITLLWDISFSGIYRNKTKEVEFIQTVLKTFPNKKINLIAFNDKIVFQKNFNSNQIDEIIAKINSFNFDGNTDLSFIENLKLKSKDLVLLFSDGINGLGQVTQPNISKSNFFSVVSSKSNNFDALQNVSYNNLLNLNRISIESAVNKIQNPSITLLNVEIVSGNVTDIYPKVGTPVNANFEVCGKFIGNEATINLVYGYPGTKLFTHTVHLKYNKNDDLTLKSDYINTLISRFWAQNEIQNLQKLLPKSNNKIKFIAKKYGIVTNFTSLIVLETVSDYFRYNVQPPVELKEEYDKYIELNGKNNFRDNIEETVDDIVNFDEKTYYIPLLNWWETPIKTKNPVKNATNTSENRSSNPNIVTNDSIRSQVNSIYRDSTFTGNGFIKGKAVDNDNIGVPFLQIRLLKNDIILFSSYTDENGEYSIDRVPIGEYSLVAGGTGLCLSSTRINNIRNNGSTVTFYDFVIDCANAIEEVSISYNSEVLLDRVENNVTVESDGSFFADFNSSEEIQGAIIDGESGSGSGVGNSSDLIMIYDEYNEEINEQSATVPQKSIFLKPYTSDEQYMNQYPDSLPNKDIYQIYLESRVGFLTTPSYFVDVADVFYKRGMKDTAKMILSNILEITNENFQMVQIYGKKLIEYGFYKEAVPAFKYITELREEFPQSFRDYAIACQYAGQYQEAYDVFVFILTTRWDRFDELKPIVFTELNGLLNLYSKKIKYDNLNPKLRAHFPVGMRIVISWDTDNCDIDLHVNEPDGTTCFYGNPLTKNGGKISKDFTTGFGPEQYMMKTNMEGIYEILTKYYGTNSQSELMPVTVYADIFTDYGTPKQEHKRISLRLKNKKETYSMGEIEFKLE